MLVHISRANDPPKPFSDSIVNPSIEISANLVG